MSAWCAGLGLGVTAAVIFVPALRFSYRNPGLHIVLATIEAMIGLLVAYVIYGRFRSSREARDLALVFALSVLAASNLLFSVVPEVTLGQNAQRFATWAPLATRFVGTIAFALGALLPAWMKVSPRRTRLITSSFVVVIGGVVGTILASASLLPPPISEAIDPGASERPLIVGHPVVLVAQVGTMIFFAAAAGAFLRNAQDQNDPLQGWLGAASILAAFARLNYFLFPSLYSDFVYAGDLLRLGFYVVLLIGAAHEIRSYWQARSDAELLRVRNSLARNLHDGLAQELVFIAAQTRRFAKIGAEPTDLDPLLSASDRAVAEARRAIAALSRPMDQALGDAIAETAEEEARRTGVPVRLVLEDDVQTTLEQREALVRITREAVKNASRHGNASLITVTLDTSNGIKLTVHDDGIGFAGTSTGSAREGTGLVTMKERARAIGGELYISDAEGGGTEVRVTVPWTR